MTAVVWYVIRTVAGSSSWPGLVKEQNKYKMAANSQPRASIQVHCRPDNFTKMINHYINIIIIPISMPLLTCMSLKSFKQLYNKHFTAQN